MMGHAQMSCRSETLEKIALQRILRRGTKDWIDGEQEISGKS